MSLSFLQSLKALVGSLVLLIAFKVLKFFYREWNSPLKVLPGPPSSNIIFGNLKEIWRGELGTVEEKWIEEYGPVITYKGLLGMNMLFTTDPKVLNHIMVNSQDYQKPKGAAKSLERVTGPGLLVVEGERHKRQRRVMNPAFGSAQVRDMTDILITKAMELRDVWVNLLNQNMENGKDERIRLDALAWISKTTLDIIGVAGFHYDFKALTDAAETNELNRAFLTIFRAGMSFSPMAILRNVLPLMRFLPSDLTGESKRANATMSRIGNQLLKESKETLLGEPNLSSEKESVSWIGKDMLSLLVKANVKEDLKPNQRLTDEDVVAQIATFLVAGHETTSTGTTWALYALSQNPTCQRELREEILAFGNENPSMEELNSLPYLDAFVRESLRLYPPIPNKMRVAMKDDVLPLSNPIKDRLGRMVEGIRIKKGQMVTIPILSANRMKNTWGEDAHEFKPERWKKLPEATASVPGIWGNMLTFFAGPRSCIGYRFSLVEMKALLFTLVGTFEFELAVPSRELQMKSSIVLRPVVSSESKETANQMPLYVKLYQPMR